jgi:hypothetical protein
VIEIGLSAADAVHRPCDEHDAFGEPGEGRVK